MQVVCAGTGMKSLVVFLSSMFPFSESKGAILMGAALEVKWYISWLTSCIGSYCVVPVILFMKKQQSELLDGWSNKEKKKHTKLVGYIRKYGCWGLILLISIPFTGIGCWAGAMIARVLRLDKQKACLSIFLGNLIGGFVCVMCVYGIFAGFQLL